jgi:hypothetical protein
MQLLEFNEGERLTPFCPSWQWMILEDQIIDKPFTDRLAQIILEREKGIVEGTRDKWENFGEASNYDGATGLGPDSLTSRSPFFNVLTWDEPECQRLKFEIWTRYVKFMESLELTRPKTTIQCWANVLRYGEQIKLHAHGYDPTTYLSGHFCVQSKGTHTHYFNTQDLAQIPNAEPIFSSPNVPGKITLFQAHMPHATDQWLVHDKERITIAFDIEIEEVYSREDARQRSYIPFDDGGDRPL